MSKNQHKCFMIFHHGIESISMDISMHRIEIIEIENNLSIYRIEKKILNNDIPNVRNPPNDQIVKEYSHLVHIHTDVPGTYMVRTRLADDVML